MSGPRIAQADHQIGFHWIAESGAPISLTELVRIDDEPQRLPPTHLEAMDDALIDAAARFGELLGGGRPPAPGQERAELAELHGVLDRLAADYADALIVLGLRADIRGGQIIGTSALFATRARMALGVAGPFPLAGQLDDPQVGVVAGHGRLVAASADPEQSWRGSRWVVESEDGHRYPLTLSMLLFDSSGANKDAALDEHRAALAALVATSARPATPDVDPVILAAAIEWLLFDFLMAHRESPDSAAIELGKGGVDDARLVVAAAAAVARLRRAENPPSGADHPSYQRVGVTS